MSPIGIVFLGHGTRKQRGIDEFLRFTRAMQREICESGACKDLYFAHGFLELAEPSLLKSLRGCVQHQVSEIVVVPLLLFDAGHMKVDIPAVFAKAQETFLQHLSFKILPAVGFHDSFVQATVRRMRQGGFSSTQDALLLLGRGNGDVAAQLLFERIAQHVQVASEAACVQTGYLAGTGRSWRTVLDSLVRQGHEHIYVQPYLWFHGWLTENLPTWLRQWQDESLCDGDVNNTSSSRLEIRIGEPLGLHDDLVKSMVSRIMAILQTP